MTMTRAIAPIAAAIALLPLVTACGPTPEALEELSVDQGNPPAFDWNGEPVSWLVVYPCPGDLCPELPEFRAVGDFSYDAVATPVWAVRAVDGFECTVPILEAPVAYGTVPPSAARGAVVFQEPVALTAGERFLVAAWRVGDDGCLDSTVDVGAVELIAP